MALQNGANLTFRQAIKRGAPVWNFRASNWGNYPSGLAGTNGDLNSYPLFPPAYSVNGFAIAPDSTARQALIQWEPAGLPLTDFGGGFQAWTTRGSRFLLTKDAPLLLPLQGRISILPYAEDMYGATFLDIDGVEQAFGSAQPLLMQPFISIYCFLKVPAAPVGPRRDHLSSWSNVVIPADPDEGIIAIIPAHGRRSVRFNFRTDAGASDADVRVTGINGFGGVPGSTGLQEVPLPGLTTQTIPGAGGIVTMEAAINTQYLVIRMVSSAAASTGGYQWELRDSAGCCESFASTPVPPPEA